MSADIQSMVLDWSTGVCLRPLATKYNISPATAKKYLNNAGVNTSKKKCYTKAVWDIITAIQGVLDENEYTYSVRQMFYQLSTRGVVPLDKKGYNSTQSALNKGRKHGHIPWDRIEDRTRQPHTPPSWDGIDDFMNSVLAAYRRDIWTTQPEYFEVWLEKNALFGVINPVCNYYGVTLQTITGYSSISAVYDGAERFKRHDKETNTIFYLGDHDATGIDIDRSLKESFIEDHGIDINIIRIGLLYEDIDKYDLPPNPLKKTDTRAKKYQFEKQAELDALSPDILIPRVQNAIEDHLDIDAYNHIKNIEHAELNKIQTSLCCVQGVPA